MASTAAVDAGRFVPFVSAEPAANPNSPAFFGLVNLLLKAEGGVESGDDSLDSIISVSVASPALLADALIRSMLAAGAANSALQLSDLPLEDSDPALEVDGDDLGTATGSAADLCGEAIPAEPTILKKKSDGPTPDETTGPPENVLAPITSALATPLAAAAPFDTGPERTGASGEPMGRPPSDGQRISQDGDVNKAAASTPRMLETESIAFRALLTEKNSVAPGVPPGRPTDSPATDPQLGQALPLAASANGDDRNSDGRNGDERRREPATSEVQKPESPALGAISDDPSGHAMATASFVAANTAATPVARSSSTAEIPAVSGPAKIIETPAPLPTPSNPQEIVVHVARPEAPPVDVQIRQRAGEIQVAVRTPDASLERSLRSELPELVGSLDRAGYHAQVFTGEAGGASGSIAGVLASGRSEFMDGRSDSSNQQRANSDPSSGRDGHSRNSGGGAHQQDPQRQRDRFAESWLKRMEE